MDFLRAQVQSVLVLARLFLDHLREAFDARIAIYNNRPLDFDDGKVQFRWKDYRNSHSQKTMTLGANLFIRWFLLHVLPNGLPRGEAHSVPATHANVPANGHPQSQHGLQRSI